MHVSNKRLARDLDGLKRVFHQFWIQSAVRNKTSMRNLFLLIGVFLMMEGVFGADGGKAVSSNVGEDVTLETDDAEVQRADELLWRIQGETSVIAELYRETHTVSITDDKRFIGRVQMDKRTGSLTIKNINTADAGVYELLISSQSGVKTKTFSLTVHSEVVIVEVSVMEGDSVTLNINDTKQKDEELNWKVKPKDKNDYKSINGERFKTGETGSLTITNINIKDSGLYQLESSSDIKYKARFNVTVHEGLKSVSVMEGDTITLHTGVTQILTDRLNGTGSSRSNINLNKETGEITIRNIRGDQSGDLEVKINTSNVALHRKFSINISGVFSDEKDGVKTVSEKTGNSVVLDTYLNKIQNDDISIEWTFGPQNISIAKTDGKSKNEIYNYNDVRFKNRLNLQIDSGDLTIKNASSEHSGLYQLKIMNNTYTIQKRFSVTVSDSGLSSGAAGILGVLAAVIVAAAGVIYYQYTIISKLKKQSVSVTDQNQDQDETTPTVNNHHL